MLSIELAAAFVSLSIDRSRFDSDLGDVNRRLQALPDRITIAITASTVGLDAVLSQVQQLHALANQPIIFQVGAAGSLPDAVATSGRAAQMTAATAVMARAGSVGAGSTNVPSVDVGLTQLQAAGLSYQGRIQSQAEREGALAQRGVVAAQRDAAKAAIASGAASSIHGPTIDVSVSQLAASGLKMQDRARKESDQAEEAAARAAQRRSARMQENVSQFGMGLGMATGLPLAFSPAMMAGTALGGGVAGSVRTAMEMESQFAELRRVTGMNAQQGAAFQTQLMRFGATTGGASTQDLIRMAQIGGQAGVYEPGKAGHDSAALMKFVQDLARVKLAMSDMDTEVLANQIAKVLHVMDEGIDKTAGFGSALNRLAAMSTASGSEILDVTNRIASFGHSAEMTIPQLTALASVMIDVGFTPEVAGSAAQRLFTLMSSKSAQTAQAIGISAKEMRAALEQGPLVALQLVLNKLNETGGTVAKQEFITSLGLPSGGASRLLQAISGQGALIRERAEIAAEEMRSEASLGTTEAEKGATAGANIQQLQNAFTALQAELGVHFIPVLKDAVLGMTDFVKSLSVLTGGSKSADARVKDFSGPLYGGNPLTSGVVSMPGLTAMSTMMGTPGLTGAVLSDALSARAVESPEQRVQHAGVVGRMQQALFGGKMAELEAPLPALQKWMAAPGTPGTAPAPGTPGTPGTPGPTGTALNTLMGLPMGVAGDPMQTLINVARSGRMEAATAGYKELPAADRAAFVTRLRDKEGMGREAGAFEAENKLTAAQVRAPWDFMHSVHDRLLGADPKKLGGVFGAIGETGHLVRQQAGHLHALPTPRHLDAGLSAADVGRRLQEAALNKDDEKERKKIELMTQNNGILTRIQGLLGAGLGRARSIIEGGHGTSGHK